VRHAVDRKTVEAMRIGGQEFTWGKRTYIMAVLNVTPDSFSGDGAGDDMDAAVDLALRFEDEGADIIDIGGESTRPPNVYSGAQPVSKEEEMRRVLPVIERLSGRLLAPMSIDTRKAGVAAAAVEAGAAMVNDISMLTYDDEMAETVGRLAVPLVISHIRERAVYRDVVVEVIADLEAAMTRAAADGVERESVIVDPGIGFGKTAVHSLEVLRRLRELAALGRPVLVGTSRKSSIGMVLGLPVEERVEGTAATVALSIANGADMVRVHDVREMARVARMSDAIVRGWPLEE